MDNIGMQDSILSRFDIIFIVLDEVSIIMISAGMNTELLFIELRNSILSYLDTHLILVQKLKYCIAGHFRGV